MIPASSVPKSTPQANFLRLLGAKYNENFDYQLVFPSSVPTKRRDGWQVVLEDAKTILGQPLHLIARGKHEA